jgi:hypothetical protein
MVAEVYARRLDSPLDAVLRLFDPTGRQLALNDDHEDKTSGLSTHHADSYLSAGTGDSGTGRFGDGPQDQMKELTNQWPVPEATTRSRCAIIMGKRGGAPRNGNP